MPRGLRFENRERAQSTSHPSFEETFVSTALHSWGDCSHPVQTLLLCSCPQDFSCHTPPMDPIAFFSWCVCRMLVVRTSGLQSSLGSWQAGPSRSLRPTGLGQSSLRSVPLPLHPIAPSCPHSPTDTHCFRIFLPSNPFSESVASS